MIEYFDAPAGAGKTRALSRYADFLAKMGKKVLIVQPTKVLIDNTNDHEIKPLDPDYPVTRFHGDVSDRVIVEIMKHFGASKSGPEIMMITHGAFLRIPFFASRKNWVVIVDETLGVDCISEYNIPVSHRLITDRLAVRDTGPKYARLICTKDSKDWWKNIAQNGSQDDILRHFQELAGKLTDKNWDVFTSSTRFADIVANGGQGPITIHAVLKPSIFRGFKRVIVASACMEDTMLFKLWSAKGVKLKPASGSLRKNLRYTEHENGKHVAIHYFLECEWSKSIRDKCVALNGVTATVGTHIIAAVRNMFADQDFAWMANKDLPDSVFAGHSGAMRLPNTPHGLNTYQHIHNVVVMSALNPPPNHFSFLLDQGVEGEEVRRAVYHSAVYQAAMRISIRNPADTTPKSIVVMDQGTAEWLADLFPGAAVQQAPGFSGMIAKGKAGRPAKYASGKDRVKACREKSRAELIAQLEALNEDSFTQQDHRAMADQMLDLAGVDMGEMCNEITSYKDISLQKTRFGRGSAFASFYSTDPIYIEPSDEDEFIEFLKGWHQQRVPSKKEQFLIAPAYYEPDIEGVDTRRGRANIQYLNGIWLDNDGGDLTHEEFAHMFPFNRVVVWNTYSSTPKAPRWRVFMPTTHAMTVDVYEMVIRQIEATLKANGYVRKDAKSKSRMGQKHHGFDTGKFVATSVFYLPGQAADPAGSFFVDYAGEERGPLNVLTWLDDLIVRTEKIEKKAAKAGSRENAPVPPQTNVSPKLKLLRDGLKASRQNYSSARRVEEAIDQWRSAPKGHGHAEFFRLAARLKAAGMTVEEVEEHLHAECAFAKSPAKRRSEIKGICKTLRDR